MLLPLLERANEQNPSLAASAGFGVNPMTLPKSGKRRVWFVPSSVDCGISKPGVNQGVQTRLNPSFGPIIYGRTISIADGHYATVMVSKRFSHSYQLRGIFTFGKSTDDMSSNDKGTNNGEAHFQSAGHLVATWLVGFRRNPALHS